MDGLEQSRYSGSVDIRLTYRDGDITLLLPTVKDDTAPAKGGGHHAQ
jgi:hypothetical protein